MQQLGTLPTSGIAAVVMMAVKSGVLRPLQRALGGVGQTALSNYLLITVLCQFLFLWGPWYFGSTVDWLWRSLTCVKLQPMIKRRSYWRFATMVMSPLARDGPPDSDETQK